jgi:hypothetical protein
MTYPSVVLKHKNNKKIIQVAIQVEEVTKTLLKEKWKIPTKFKKEEKGSTTRRSRATSI